MAIIKRRRKNGTFSFLVRIKDFEGRWLPALSFNNLKDAKSHEAHLNHSRTSIKAPAASDGAKYTLDEYWQVWSFQMRSDVSPGWQISQNQMFKDYIKPILGHLPLASINSANIGSVLQKARAQGRKNSTCIHIYNLLRKLFSDAVEYYEMLLKSPVQAKFHRPKRHEVLRSFYSPKDAWRLLNISRDHYLGPAIWIALFAGLRAGEIQSLRWSHLLFELNQIIICSTYNRKIGKLQNYPKGRSFARVPMDDALKQYLKSLKRAENDFVVQGPNQQGMLAYTTFNKGLKGLCLKLGLPPLTPHELRHSCSELWMREGATAEDIRRLLNHKSLSITMKYIHRTDERLEILRKQIGETKEPSSAEVKKVSQKVSQMRKKEEISPKIKGF